MKNVLPKYVTGQLEEGNKINIIVLFTVYGTNGRKWKNEIWLYVRKNIYPCRQVGFQFVAAWRREPSDNGLWCRINTGCSYKLSTINLVWGPLKCTKSNFNPVHVFLHFKSFCLVVLQLILASKLSDLKNGQKIAFLLIKLSFLANGCILGQNSRKLTPLKIQFYYQETHKHLFIAWQWHQSDFCVIFTLFFFLNW